MNCNTPLSTYIRTQEQGCTIFLFVFLFVSSMFILILSSSLLVYVNERSIGVLFIRTENSSH